MTRPLLIKHRAPLPGNVRQAKGPKSWMTHSEVIRPSLGEFETCPDWVPSMDTGQRVARIILKTMDVYGFDHRANRVAKVRNVSRLGSHKSSR